MPVSLHQATSLRSTTGSTDVKGSPSSSSQILMILLSADITFLSCDDVVMWMSFLIGNP